MSVMDSAARAIRSGSPTDTQTVSRTPHARGILVLFRSRTTSYQPPFTPDSIDNSTRLDGSDTFNRSALAGTLLMCASHCVNVSISSFRWILGLICNRDLFSKKKSVQDEIFDFFAHMLLLRSGTFDVLSLKLRQFL